MKIIDLRSDTVTKPTEEMRQAMYRAEVGDVVLNDDPTVLELEEMGAALFGKEACLFTASGTMSNQIAVFALTQRADQILVHKDAHIFNLERSGLAQISGVQCRLVRTEQGRFDLDDLKQNLVSDSIQSARTSLICMENTFNLNDGLCIPKSHIDDVAEIAKQHGLQVYMDGARILNAAISLGEQAKDLVENCDVVSLCISKGLACPVGSILCGSREFIERARFIRQMLGGGWRQGGIVAAAGVVALNNIQRLQDDHDRAKALKEGLKKISSQLELNAVETNILTVDTAALGISSDALVEALDRQGLRVKKIGESKVRMITHIDFQDEDIQPVLTAWENVLEALGD
ncbi:MAG: GntG family PLP-dependent aldolase [Tissierellia bacterium]|nr:GntG family PLP-dependent aldolase [Tissierellia bacterium]